MVRKPTLVLGGLVGAVGISGVWIFHYILDVNAAYITSHKALTAIVGAADCDEETPRFQKGAVGVSQSRLSFTIPGDLSALRSVGTEITHTIGA